jgi:hypothetical protein
MVRIRKYIKAKGVSMTHTKRGILAASALICVTTLVFTVCAQKADPESDFKVQPIDGGKGVEITAYLGDKWEVVIPTKIRGIPVTHIGEEVFNKKSLIKVTLPNSLTTIGEAAFAENQLTRITIPNRVTTIGDGAFYDNQLTKVTIGANVDFERGLRVFGDGFDEIYFSGDKLAGTYKRPDTESTTWTAGKSSANRAARVSGNSFKGANFGRYPADYPIKYLSMVVTSELSDTLTVRTLFGPDAHFVTSFTGSPAVVTLESSQGAQERFTAQLLLTLKASEGGFFENYAFAINF